jgi:two-component system, chemotaxis family, CheB/CheR fusion protein
MTSMPVIQVSEPIKVEANCVYVIPPRKHLLMEGGHLIITVLPHEYGQRSAVDIFFRTLPKRIGPAVFLSGQAASFCTVADGASYVGER